MEETSGNTFANRDSPIPVVRFSNELSPSLSSDVPENTNLRQDISPGKEQSRRWLFRQKAKDILTSTSSGARTNDAEKEAQDRKSTRLNSSHWE